MGFEILGLGFGPRSSDLGLKIQDLGFRVYSILEGTFRERYVALIGSWAGIICYHDMLKQRFFCAS